MAALVIGAAVSSSLASEPWNCDFTKSLDSRYWTPTIVGNSDFTYTTTEHGLRVAGAAGGGGFQAARLLLNLDNFAGGLTDFDAVVTFEGAVFTENWRHQVQMEFSFPNTGQYIAVVKNQSNVHVWRDPPASEAGNSATSATAGTMRVVRSGATIAAYWDNSATPFWSENYGTSPLNYFALALNQNSTSAASAVTWKTFSIAPSPIIAPALTIFTTDTSIGTANTTYEGQQIVVDACTLTVDGPHAFANVLVRNGGVLTHSPAPNGEPDNRLDLTIAGDITVDATSRIDLAGRGYRQQAGPGNGYEGGSGAAYGGEGGSSRGGAAPGVAYGSMVGPLGPGSGGGSAGYGGVQGGAGGGVMKLVVTGVLTINGVLSANGINGGVNESYNQSQGGGGSGGSIWISAGALAGSGAVTANGGSSPGTSAGIYGGGGGGGRLALYYTSNAFAGTLAATGGTGAANGGAGTIYRQGSSDAHGSLLVSNGVVSAGWTPLTSYTPYDAVMAAGALVYTPGPVTLSGLAIQAGGIVSHKDAVALGVNLTVLGDALIDAGAMINTDGKGCRQQSGPGAGYEGGSGAGYGGAGGRSKNASAAGMMYGSQEEPVALGSGGGSAGYGGVQGGLGGGVVKLVVAGTLTIDGLISANGTDGGINYSYSDSQGGGGSGGSIWLIADHVAGAGSITANGGIAPGTWPVGEYRGRFGGGGGGGRIAIYQHGGSGAPSTSVSTAGGIGYVAGQAGTIYLPTAMPPMEGISLSPTGTLKQAVSSVDVAFNQAVRSESFTPADVFITTPSGSIPTADITVTPLSAAGFSITFPPQTTVGSYQIQIGPHLENLYGQEMAAAYTGGFTIANPVISGFVRMADGTPVANVQLSTDSGLITSSNGEGAYSLAVPPAWSGTLTPAMAGWVFTPASRSYANLTADAGAVNFTMDLAQTAVLTLTRTNDTLYFGWPSAVGLNYQLQSSTSLLPDSWTNEGVPFAGTGAQLTTNLLIGTEPEKFYRLRIDN